MDIQQIKTKYCMDISREWGSVVFSGQEKNLPESVKKYFDKRNAAATNKEFQAAKRKWLAEMDRFLDGKIKVQPKMPRLEDYLKR